MPFGKALKDTMNSMTIGYVLSIIFAFFLANVEVRTSKSKCEFFPPTLFRVFVECLALLYTGIQYAHAVVQRAPSHKGQILAQSNTLLTVTFRILFQCRYAQEASRLHHFNGDYRLGGAEGHVEAPDWMRCCQRQRRYAAKTGK